MYGFHGLKKTCLLVLALASLGLADQSRAATDAGGAGEGGLVGTAYVSSLEDNAVLRYVDGQFVEVFAAASKEVSLSRPHGILARCQDVLVASFGTDTVLRFDRATGAYLGVFLDAEDGIDAPVYIAEGPDGNLYISSRGTTASYALPRMARSWMISSPKAAAAWMAQAALRLQPTATSTSRGATART